MFHVKHYLPKRISEIKFKTNTTTIPTGKKETKSVNKKIAHSIIKNHSFLRKKANN